MGKIDFKLRSALHSLLYVWWQEMKLSVRDQGMLIFFYLFPLFYPLLYAFIYNEETVHEVPAVALDESHSALSREFLREMDGTPAVHFVAYAADMEEARAVLREQGAYGIVRIPASFASDLAQRSQTRVFLYCDMSGLLYYKSLLMSATDVSLEMNADIRIAASGNTTDEQDETTAQPIAYRDVPLFNSTAGFAAFLIPAVLMLVLQQIMLLGVGLSVGTAREMNRFRDFVPMTRYHRSVLPLVFGKALCYFLITLASSAYVLCVVPQIFRLNRLAAPGDLLAFVVPYLLACVFFAMTCSVFVKRRENCMPVFVFSSLPLLFISGISWPGTSIPEGWRWFSCLFPSTFGINGYVRLNTMGASLYDVLPEYRALWIQAGVYFLTTCLVYKWNLLLARSHVRERYRQLRSHFVLRSEKR
ncbi:MAG: ABC transporter permease [Bacteroidaceae bacterium]|jgi:ABC-2 type transport system permease protein